MSEPGATSWNRISIAPHRAVIAGKVVDGESGRPVPGVVAEIVSMPQAFQTRMATMKQAQGPQWEKADERPDRTKSAFDGCFCFRDLPPGDYEIVFELPREKYRYGALTHPFTVVVGAGAQARLVTAMIKLAPTGIRGRVQGLVQGTPIPLPLARIRVEGTGELAYSDEEGHFCLTGVELGDRMFCIRAAGFEPATTIASVSRGEILDLGLITLETLNH